MHTPLWIKIGMGLGFAYIGIYGINAVGNMLGGGEDGHGDETHIASTEHTDAGDTAGHAAEDTSEDATGEHADTTNETAATGEGTAEDTGADVGEDTSEAATDEGTGEDAGEVTEVAAVAGDAEAGAKSAKKKCGTCHSFDEGGPNKVGPNLWGVSTRDKAGLDSFKYSSALKDMGGDWTHDDLTHFIDDPKGFAKGTKMSFKGLDGDELANVVAYIETLK